MDVQASLVDQLLRMASRPVRPAETPDGFEPGDIVWLVRVRSSNDQPTLAQVERDGRLVSLESVSTVPRLRGFFRRDFTAPGQLFGRALADFLHPNCELDTNLTRQARDQAASQMVVFHYYNPGQVIVRRGQVVDARMVAALTQLGEIVPASQFDQPEIIQAPEIHPSSPPAKTPEQNVWLLAAGVVIPVVVLLGGMAVAGVAPASRDLAGSPAGSD